MPESGDSHIMLGHREFLQAHLQDLDNEQAAVLLRADEQLLKFAEQKYDETDDDVRILRMCVDVIESKPI